MFTSVKRGKSFVPDELVQWSATSSSDEHTHEYDGYSFHSDDEDVVIEEQNKAFDMEVHQKRKCVEDPILVPYSSDEDMEDATHVQLNPSPQEQQLSGGGSDSEDDIPLLLTQIESARLSLRAKTEELKNLKEREANPTAMDVSKQRVKVLHNIIEQNDKDFLDFSQNRDLYVSAREHGREYRTSPILLWQSKLETLKRRRRRAEKEKQSLTLQIKEKEEEYYNAAVQQVPQVDALASTAEYGCIPEELTTLRNCVQFHEKRILVLEDEVRNICAESEYYKSWSKWGWDIVGKTEDEVKESYPEPILSDFLPSKKIT